MYGELHSLFMMRVGLNVPEKWHYLREDGEWGQSER